MLFLKINLVIIQMNDVIFYFPFIYQDIVLQFFTVKTYKINS
jgi:hypothetical protein